MRRKVLFVMHTLGFGGAERSLVNLLHELPEGKYEIDLLLFQKKGAFLPQLPSWVRVLDTPDRLGRLYGSVSKAGTLAATKVVGTAAARLVRRTRKSRAAWRWKHFYMNRIEPFPQHYDVAAAFGGSELMYYVRDKVEADKKLVWIHSDYRTGQYAECDDRPYLADMDRIMSISQECVRVLEEIFPELRQKMCCTENITSSGLIRARAEAYIPREYEENGCNILSVGRLSSEKGFDLAVDAAKVLLDSGLSFKWFVVGDGVDRDKLQKRIDLLGLKERMYLLGNRENPYPYIKHCSLLVQPSRWEGKSLVLDEAKILGVPIVSTAYPTVYDQIIEGKEGILVDLTAEAIAGGIQRMCREEALRQEICTYLRQHEYSNEKEAEKYMALLDE